MKILLVMPRDKKRKRYQRLISPFITYKPLTLPTLAALVPEELQAEITVCDEMADRCERYMRKERYDVVAISFVSSEAARAYELADAFQAKASYVVLGGYHMTHYSEEGLRHAGTVIRGPAERAWPRFLRDWKKGQAQRLYEDWDICAAELPVPRRDVLKDSKYLRFPTVVANPACRRRCGFCAISRMWQCGGRPVKAVIEELRRLPSRNLVFYDPNFFDDREYSLALMKAMTPLGLRWAGAACVDVAEDEELLHWARKSGCAGLLLGLESLNQRVLDKTCKGFNQPDQYKERIRKIQSYGVSVNGCFVLGMDGDSAEDLLSLPDQIEELGVNLTRFSILTPLPGSELFCQMKEQGRILTEDWRDYTQSKVVFQPEGMTPQRLEEIYNQVWQEAYSWRRIFRRVRNIQTNSVFERLVLLGANIGFKYLGKDM